MSLWDDKEKTKRRKVSPQVTEQDRETLRQNYTFLPDATQQRQSWQGRMVLQYHNYLYKDYVLANMTRVQQRQLGLRWRTIEEVRSGQGADTCGNLHCPSLLANSGKRTGGTSPRDKEPDFSVQEYLQMEIPEKEKDEKECVDRLPPGSLLTDFEVPFNYREQGERKTELVKLGLCVRCAPLLFQSKGEKKPYLAARQARNVIAQAISTKERDEQLKEEAEVARKKRKSDDIPNAS